MQKKILVSLLMTAPVGFAAYADIDLPDLQDPHQWFPNGLAGDGYQLGDNSLSSQIGNGELTQVVKGLPKGEYLISFETFENFRLEVRQNGELLKVKSVATEKRFEFATKAVSDDVESEIEIKLIPKTTSLPVSYTGCQLILKYDFPAEATRLFDLRWKLLPGGISNDSELIAQPAEGVELPAELKTRLDGLVARYNQVSRKIGAMKADAGTSDKELMNLYKGEKLYNDVAPYEDSDMNSAISNELRLLKEEVEAYNASVKANDLLAGINAPGGLREKLAVLITDIKSERAKVGYVDLSNCLDGTGIISSDMTKYEDKVKEAYENNNLVDKIEEFKTDYANLDKAIEDLRAKFNADKEDNAAFKEYTELKKSLKDEYEKSHSAISAFKGITLYPDVYSSVILDWLGALYDIYDKACAKDYGFKDSVTADDSENIGVATVGISADIKALQDALAGYRKIVDDQNAWMEFILEDVYALSGELDEAIKRITAPNDFKDEYDAKVGAIREAIDALKTGAEAKYEKQGLEQPVKDTEIRAMIEELKLFVKPFATLNELMKKLDENIGKVAAMGNIPGTCVPYAEKFGTSKDLPGTYNNISNAIKELTPDEEGNLPQNEVDNVTAQIERILTDAKALEKIYQDIENIFVDYQSALDGLVEYVDGKENGNKIVLPEADRDDVKKAFIAGEAYIGLNDRLNADKTGLVAERNSTAALSGQECYDDGKALLEKLQKDTWKAEIDELKKEFSGGVTKDINFVNTESKLKKAGEDAGISGTGTVSKDYLGVEDMKTDIDELRTKLASIQAEMNAASDISGYDAVDAKLKALWLEIEEFNQTVDGLILNQDAYDQLVGRLPSINSGLDNLKEYNDDNSVDNGKAYFAAIIGEPGDEANADGSFYAQLEQYRNDIEDAYNKKNAYKEWDNLNKKLNDLNEAIDDTLKADQLNNEYHESQIQKWNEVSAKLTNAIASLDDKDTGLVAVWKEALEALRTNERAEDPDLMQVSGAISEAYGSGKSCAENPSITDDLKYISDEIDRILGEIEQDYPGKVDNHNKDIVNECGWTANIAELQQTYAGSINTFNEFYYNLNNIGYRTVLKPEMKRHEGIYEYSKIIRELPGQMAYWLEEQKNQLHLITAEEFNAEWTARAQGYIQEMRNKVTEMNLTANSVAVNYYVRLHAQAKTVISDAEDKLQSAGITGRIAEECLSSVNNGLENAEWAYHSSELAEEGWQNAQEWAEKAAFQKDLPGLAMDRIADLLDKVLDPANIDFQKAAQAAWGEAYPSQSELDEMRKVFLGKDDGGTCLDADRALKEQMLWMFDEAEMKLKALGREVDAITEGLIDVYADKKAELDELMDILNGCVDQVKESQDNAVDEKNAYDEATGDIAGLSTSYDGLLDYLKGFSQAYHIGTDAIANAIEGLGRYVEDNRGKLTTPEVSGYIENAIAAIGGDIVYAKQRVSSLELDYVGKTLADRVKVAFNDAKVKTTGNEEELDKINDRIDAVIEAVNALPADFFAEGFDFDAYKAAVLEQEEELCGILQTLDAMWTGDKHDSDPAQSAIDRLDARYNEVAGAIAGGQTGLDACLDEIKAKYEAEYADLKTRLDGVKADWSDDRNSIIAQEANHMNGMDKIAAALEALNAEVKAANDKAVEESAAKEANQNAYDALKAEHDQLNAEFEAVKTLIASYGENEPAYWSYEISRIASLLESSLADLDMKYADTRLTAESTLQDAVEIAAQTADLKVKSTRRYAGGQLDAAGIALQAASNSLVGYIVPEEAKALAARLKTLHDSFGQIRWEVSGADYARLTEIVEEARRIAAEAQEIAESAAANKYVPGDVNLSPDGTVNSADVMQLIDWVGEGMTYEQLYAESPRQACAADLTADEMIDIADVTMDIQLSLGMRPGQVRAKRFLGHAAGDNTFTLSLVSEENGVKRYALIINNSAAFVAGQLDIKIGNGSEIVDVKNAGRTAAHDIYLFDGSFGAKRVLIASMANAEIEGNGGEVIYIDVEGNGKPDVEGAIFADGNAVSYEVKKSGSSLVDSIIDSAKETKEKIYNVAGQTLNKLQRGINIVRRGNGKASKEMHK